MSDASTNQTEYPAESMQLINISHDISPTFSNAMNGSACIFQSVFFYVYFKYYIHLTIIITTKVRTVHCYIKAGFVPPSYPVSMHHFRPDGDGLSGVYRMSYSVSVPFKF